MYQHYTLLAHKPIKVQEARYAHCKSFKKQDIQGDHLKIAILSALALTLLSFQNCSDMQFNSPEEAQLSSLAEEEPQAPAAATPAPQASGPSDDLSHGQFIDNGGFNQFNSIDSGAFVLVCNKRIKSITSVNPDAKVVIVDGSLGSVTSIAGEVVMANSSYEHSPPSNMRIEQSSAAINNWRTMCNSHGISQAVSGNSVYRLTDVNSSNVSLVPSQSRGFRFTSISTDLGVLNTDHITFTSIQEGIKVYIKTKTFQVTGVSRNAEVVFY